MSFLLHVIRLIAHMFYTVRLHTRFYIHADFDVEREGGKEEIRLEFENND